MQLVILMGLPASGKTTFRSVMLPETYRVVSKDLMPNNRNRELKQQKLIEEALAASESVIVDNTNISVADRAALIALGRRHRADVIGYYFQSRPDECLQRNKQRTGRACVPPVAIFAMLKRLERPCLAEGFDLLYFVIANSDNTFRIEAWNEEQAE